RRDAYRWRHTFGQAPRASGAALRSRQRQFKTASPGQSPQRLQTPGTPAPPLLIDEPEFVAKAISQLCAMNLGMGVDHAPNRLNTIRLAEPIENSPPWCHTGTVTDRASFVQHHLWGKGRANRAIVGRTPDVRHGVAVGVRIQ